MTAHETIDTHEPIHIFHELMQADAQKRIFCLIGDGKMGKSHLLMHVLSPLAERDYQARSALLDLGYSFSTIPDVLGQACTQLGDHYFHAYHAAEQGWLSRPKVDVKGITATLSRITVSNRDHQDEARSQARYLTSQFIKDISQLADHPLLLLFDSIEKVSAEMQWWLMENLLLSTSRLKHIRVVLAGRSLPEPHGSYRALCQSHQLLPITQINEYVTYCQQSNITLSENTIRTLAHAFGYIPGAFVDVLPRFTNGAWTDG
jgi:hypothetical protein